MESSKKPIIYWFKAMCWFTTRKSGINAVNLKALLGFGSQGRLEPQYLQNYLDDFVFRFNRRKSKSIGKKFMRIVQQAVQSAKITCKESKWDMDPISEYFTTGAF